MWILKHFKRAMLYKIHRVGHKFRPPISIFLGKPHLHVRFLVNFLKFFYGFQAFWFLEILGRLWSFRWFWCFDGDFCWTVLLFMAQIILQIIINSFQENSDVFDGDDEIEVLIVLIFWWESCFGRLEGFFALLVFYGFK